jgi:ATP-dependent Zn protease
MNEWLSLLVSWLPFIALIVVWVLLSRRRRGRGGESIALMRASVELQKRMDACLEETKFELKRR